jgi:hypothetical protein
VQRETPRAFVHSAADRWRDAQHLWGLLRCASRVGGGSQGWPPIGSLSANGNRSRMRQRAGKTGASHGPFSAPGRISPRFVMVSMHVGLTDIQSNIANGHCIILSGWPNPPGPHDRATVSRVIGPV